MPETTFAPMRDPMAKWTPVPDWSKAALTRDDWSARPVAGLSLTLIAGNIAAACAALIPGLPELGLWHIASAPAHVIRIARDKALIVTPEPIDLAAGWNPAGFSATDATSAYGAIEIEGPALRDIIAEATALDIDAGSRSASVLLAGIPCLLIRKAPDVASVFAEMGFVTYLWRWLEARRMETRCPQRAD